MRDEEMNELVVSEKSSVSTGKSGEIDEGTLYAMQSLTDMVAGLSQQVAQNNAAKYRAQAEMVIAEIEKNKETELREIDRYYDDMMKKGDDMATQIADSQRRMASLMEQGMNAQNQEQREYINGLIRHEREYLNGILEKDVDVIRGTQDGRVQNSKPRNKGLFGFLKRK